MGTPDTVVSAVVLFDGVCNLCNSFVQFIIMRDPKSRIHFAALQSNYGQEQLNKFSIPASLFESIVLIKKGKIYQHSNAVLEICRLMGAMWPVLYIFKIIPAFIRDLIYNWIANNRYRWFGRQEECMIPTPALKARFLD